MTAIVIVVCAIVIVTCVAGPVALSLTRRIMDTVMKRWWYR